MPKRYLFVSLALLASQVVSAQVVITQAGLPSPGNRVWLSTADILAGIDLTQTGPNFTWDFSQMGAIAQRKDTFVSYNSVSLFLRFLFPTNTNVVRLLETPDSIGGIALRDGYEFLHKSAGAYRSYGFGSLFQGLPVSFVNTPPDTLFKLPLAYGDSNKSAYQAILSIPGIAYYRQRRQRSYQVDGWGSVSTPYQSYQALRVVTAITGEDSLSFGLDSALSFSGPIPASKAYEWWSVQEPVPVLRITTIFNDSLGIQLPGPIAFIDSFRPRSIPLSISKQPAALGIYPNPASDKTRLDLPSGWMQGRLVVADAQGRVLFSRPWTPDLHTLDLSALPTGMYSLRLETAQGVFQGKLLVQR